MKYYTPSGEPEDLSRARAVVIRAEFQSIAQGFALAEIDTNRAITLPAGESVEIVEGPAERAGSVMVFGSTGELTLFGAGDAERKGQLLGWDPDTGELRYWDYASTITSPVNAAAASAASAANSASSAAASASSAASSASDAAASANSASNSASAAASSASNAASSASSAAASATSASQAASSAAASATNAAASASDAAASASSASASATDAASSAASAASSATSAASSLAQFRGTYLGAYASAPTTDPNGAPVDVGDLYFDTTDTAMKVWDGATWRVVGPGVTVDADLFAGLPPSEYVRIDGRSKAYGAVDLPAGWYTIATNVGNRAAARFALVDLRGGQHQTVVFYASHHYGVGNDITVLHQGRYSGTPFRYIRIKDGSTYDGALLQVYIDSSSNLLTAMLLGDDVQTDGWQLCDWIPDGTDPGTVNNFTALTNVAAQVDLDNITDGGMATTGEIYAGGRTAQHKVWHAGNDGAGSGLDADTVDGLQASQFVRTDAVSHINVDAWAPVVVSGTPDSTSTASLGYGIHPGGDSTKRVEYSSKADGGFRIYQTSCGAATIFSNAAGAITVRETLDAKSLVVSRGVLRIRSLDTSDSSGPVIYYNRAANELRFYPTGSTGVAESSPMKASIYYNGTYRQIWHAGNDGAGSGLDADTVDGWQATALHRSLLDTVVPYNGATEYVGVVFDRFTALGRYKVTLIPDVSFYSGNPFHRIELLVEVSNDGTTGPTAKVLDAVAYRNTRSVFYPQPTPTLEYIAGYTDTNRTVASGWFALYFGLSARLLDANWRVIVDAESGPFVSVSAGAYSGRPVSPDPASAVATLSLRVVEAPFKTAYVGGVYSNGWVDYSAEYGSIEVKAHGGVAVMSGLVKSGTIGSAVVTLPEPFRPRSRVICYVMSNGSQARLDIFADGRVVPISGSNVWFSLNASWPTA